VATHVAQALGLGQQEIGIVFIGDRKMRRLNRQYRGKTGSTDVLSFGQTGIAGYLGDVFISVETASVNALRAGHSLPRETAVLVLHGLLHLAGYDHETDRGEMKALERKMRRSRLLHAGS
jgi:probable rRNA maturation factor